jgi:transporter family protein
MPTWIIYAVISAFFAALTAIFAKVGLKTVDADLATAVRTAIVLVITWAFVLFKSSPAGLGTLSRSNWLFLTLSALATGFSWLFYYRALQLGKASEVSVIDKGSLLFTIILSVLILKEPLTPKVIIGSVLVFGGMLVIVWK